MQIAILLSHPILCEIHSSVVFTFSFSDLSRERKYECNFTRQIAEFPLVLGFSDDKSGSESATKREAHPPVRSSTPSVIAIILIVLVVVGSLSFGLLSCG
ncbi:hypothetical protein L6164_032442 [Bauhinia variegata]|uniref:Uncharacterized protein n=1 Tax=Bauhinia variegata TaxID=167791 RepID=A0ACB9KNS6_BAUVA|nr:hypothetical protein L6164_032442 [Bauhinia variegata]